MGDFDLNLPAGMAQAEGKGWSVRVRPVADNGSRAQRIPIRSRFTSIGPLGTYLTRMRAGGRLLRVHTQVEGETLGGWLGSGTHLAVSLTGRMHISAPQAA